MEQLNYSPEQFARIVPELTVPDYVKPYSDSMSAFIDSEKSILDDIKANYKVDEKNLLQSQATQTLFANLSKTFSEQALKIDAQMKETAYDETFMKVYNMSRDERLKAAEEQQQAENAEKAESDKVTGQLATVARNNPEDAGSLNYAMSLTGYRRIAALNALALARTDQYPNFLENLSKARTPKNPQEARALLAEGVRLFGQQTGFNQANESFIAKNVMPALSESNERWLARWTSDYNITQGKNIRAAADADFLGTGDFKTWWDTVKGTTGADGRMYTNDQAIATIRRLVPNMSEDAWRSFGDSNNEVTNKPWREDPRWGEWDQIRQAEILRQHSARERQQLIIARRMVDDFGDITLGGIDVLRQQMEAAGLPQHIIQQALGTARGAAQETIQAQQAQDELTSLSLSNIPRGPDGKISYEAAVRAGLSQTAVNAGVAQGVIGPDQSKLTTSQRIAQSPEFTKDLKKDIVQVIASVDPNIKVTNDGLSISGATNAEQFRSESMSWIRDRAAIYMTTEGANMNLAKAIKLATDEWTTYMKGLATDGDPNSNYYQNGQFVANQPGQITNNSKEGRAARVTSEEISKATLQNIGTNQNGAMYPEDLEYPTNGGRYSERVLILARRFQMLPYQIVDQARRNAGKTTTPQTGQSGQISMTSSTVARLQAVNNAGIQSRIRAQYDAGQDLSGTPRQKAYFVANLVKAAGGNVMIDLENANSGQLFIQGNANLWREYFNKPKIKNGFGVLSVTIDPANNNNLLVVFK